MEITLPNGTAHIKSRDDITERLYRVIDKAQDGVIVATHHLREQGFDYTFDSLTAEQVAELPEDERLSKFQKNSLIASGISNEDRAAINDYQVSLILSLTESWTFSSQVSEDSILDLKKSDFEALAKACQDELRGTVVDTSPDPNPSAPEVA